MKKTFYVPRCLETNKIFYFNSANNEKFGRNSINNFIAEIGRFRASKSQNLLRCPTMVGSI